jgi:SNF2 family DNA or RNA helicase
LKPRLTREGEILVVDLSGIGRSEFQDALPKVKAIEGRRFNPERKVWEFPARPMIAHRLIHQVGAQPSSDVLQWVKAELQRQADEVVTKLPSAAVENLVYARAADLYAHQRDAVTFLADHPLSLLADDMGLGKTIEAIATVEEFYGQHALTAAPHERTFAPKLVIAPSSMVGKWAAEIREWAPGEPVFVIDSRKPAPKRRAQLLEAIATPGAWIVVNWEQIRAQKIELDRETRAELVKRARDAGRPAAELAAIRRNKYRWVPKEPLFAETEWAAVIADEAHRAKNKDAQQTRGLWQIDAPVKLALTGTPILNSPDELWAPLAWLRPDQYGEYSPNKVGYTQFFENYVEYSEGHYGRIVTGVRNADALRFELSDKLVRRTKGQVLDLPPKIRTTIPVRLTAKQRKLYEDAETGFWFEIEQAIAQRIEAGEAVDGLAAAAMAGDVRTLAILVPNAAARVTRLRQIASTPALLGGPDESGKLDAAVEIVRDHPEQQFVIFTKFKGTASFLAERLRRRPLRLEVATLTGDTSPDERTALVSMFQAGELDVLIATIEAGGVGLTLTAADTAIFIEREWVPGINEQAEDRLHRIGQNHSVSILILEAENTVDTERIAPKNRTKELIVSSVIQQDVIPTKEGLNG